MRPSRGGSFTGELDESDCVDGDGDVHSHDINAPSAVTTRRVFADALEK